MSAVNAFYSNCDKLDNIPAINKQNWLFELDLQCKLLPRDATVLQVGSMDATRIIEILKLRPDVNITGLEIEKDFIALAKGNLRKAGFDAGMIEADITKFQSPIRYDYVTCLNNTLGYISDTEAAITHMKDAGNTVFVSVYGEAFDEKAAKEYFSSLGLQVEKAENDHFELSDFGVVKRFTRDEIAAWSGKITETPLGYFCELK
ncbi:methyltransferase domain-containing protein [Candidatus Kaiserbacteria bacterium]|nr:methyltransferase domain-containing protein [Candidatus Kaiserbacteria bacterium]